MPASAAFSRAAATASGSMSVATMRAPVPVRMAPRASARRADQAASSCPITCRNANPVRNSPGAVPVDISAASMASVPEPHMGFTSAPLPVYPAWIRHAAAKVSRMGALCGIIRYPRMDSGSPEVSSESVACRPFQCSESTHPVRSGPESGLRPRFSAMRSTTASFTRSPANRESRIVGLSTLATTLTYPSSGITSSHGKAESRAYNSSALAAENRSSWNNTRCAVRRCRFIRMQSASDPASNTPAAASDSGLYPSARSSPASTSCTPRAQVTNTLSLTAEIHVLSRSTPALTAQEFQLVARHHRRELHH